MLDSAEVARRWQQVERLFRAAVELPMAERREFLDAACEGDKSLQREVEELLAADAEAGDFITATVKAGEELLSQSAGDLPPRFGKYVVKGRLGEGGFGVVYRGLDPSLDRPVAIKACASSDDSTRRRFYREARIAAGLRHTNITTVHELGVEDGIPFLVQELLEGQDLRQLIADGQRLPLAQCLGYLVEIARGLEHAHGAGVLHRDVKPANVRILPDGSIKLMDFGIAKVLGADTGLTGTGMTLGTVGYLAPEQLRSEELDERADIFSYGILAYELLSGQRPFRGSDFSQVSYQLLYVDPPRLSEVWPQCPEDLADWVHRCLAKERVDRPGGMGWVRQRLEEIWRRLAATDLTSGGAGERAPAPRHASSHGRPRRLTPDLAPTRPMAGSPAAESEVSGAVAEAGSRRGVWAVLGAVTVALALAWLVADGRDAGNPAMATLQSSEVAAGPAFDVSVAEEPASTVPTPADPTPATLAKLGGAGELGGGGQSAVGEGAEPVADRLPLASVEPPEAGQNLGPAGDLEATQRADSADDPDPPPESTSSRDPMDPPEATAATGSDSAPAKVPVAPRAGGQENVRLDGGVPDPGPGMPGTGENGIPQTSIDAEGGEAVSVLPAETVSEPPAAPPAAPPAQPVAVAESTVRPMRLGDPITGAGPGVEPPKLVRRPQPQYPSRARRRRIEGQVDVKVLVDEYGKVLQVSAPGPDEYGFLRAARQAAEESLFEPATRDGIPGRMWTILSFDFTLD